MRLNRNQTVVLSNGVITLLLLGLLYVWSIFVKPLEDEFGWNRSETSMIYTISIICFSVGVMIGGLLIQSKSPRFANALGFTLVSVGFMASSQINSLFMLYILYGAFGGLGIGICYNSWLSVVLARFPGNTGFAGGILILGFGLGGTVLGPVVSVFLLSPLGWRYTFLILGAVILLEGLISQRVLRAPDVRAEGLTVKMSGASTREGENSLTTGQMLRQPCFWTYLAWKCILFCGGNAIVGQVAPIVADMGGAVYLSTMAVSLLSMGNGLGRVTSGIVFDLLGHRITMIALTVMFCLCAVVLMIFYPSGMLVPVVSALFISGVWYGGVSTVAAAFIVKVFGPKHFSSNMGFNSLVNVPFTLFLSSYIGFVRFKTGAYTGYFNFMFAAGIVAMILALATGRLIEKCGGGGSEEQRG
ncbi:MAG: MFS transporter [Synergistaceae bacterium]|jgi:OFA family oxalate/formate antiporter-like MFS transporter|nr:MFS transporter [Synergistaceae bacterium]